jgi:hypothetical protein
MTSRSMPFFGTKYSFVLANAAKRLLIFLSLEPAMMFSLAVACELTAFKSNYTRLNTVISSSKALEGVPLWRCSVTSALSSSSGPSLDKITSGFWSFSERLVVSSKTEMYFPQVGLHAIISSERTCKKEHTYQLQVGFAVSIKLGQNMMDLRNFRASQPCYLILWPLQIWTWAG